MKPSIKNNWHKIYFALAVMMIVFLLGMISGALHLFPFPQIQNSILAFKDLTTERNYVHYAGIRPEKFIRPARENIKGEGVTLYNKESAQQGLTFITSMWDHSNGMNLIDMDGNVLHEWRVSFNDIWKDDKTWPIKEIGDWDTDIHGAILYLNGDVVFNFEYDSLIKIDQCSNVIWKLKGLFTHHSVEQDNAGNLWVAGKGRLLEPDSRFPFLKAPIEEDFILKVSPEGKVLEKISILEVLYQSEYYSVLFADGVSILSRKAEGITHLNDIEILDASIADSYSQFNAGDILVSLRNLNLLMVIDSKSKKIKWTQTGPYLRQHDPDFIGNGLIGLFDNRADGFASTGSFFGGSRILSINPVTREIKTLYEGSPQNPFYTFVRGKQQFLDKGNILISEHGAGRSFEINSNQKIVWSYVNRYNENAVYKLTEATRYPLTYANFLNEKRECP